MFCYNIAFLEFFEKFNAIFRKIPKKKIPNLFSKNGHSSLNC
jgi:hypothetical protein